MRDPEGFEGHPEDELEDEEIPEGELLEDEAVVIPEPRGVPSGQGHAPIIFVHLDDIQIPEGRYRKAFPEQAQRDLGDSIKRIGLLNAPTVERSGDVWTLRAGERRLRVLKGLLEQGLQLRIGDTPFSGNLVPVVEFAQLSPLQRLEVEIEENTVRLDFDFKERAAALARLHEFRTAQNPAQTPADTANEALGRPASTEITNALIITQHLGDPDVAKTKNSKEALAVIRKKAEAIHQARLAKSVDVAAIKHKLILGDCLAILPTLPEKSFDVILTDPIYGIGANQFGSQSSLGHDYQDSYTTWKRMFTEVPDQLARVAKDRAHCYLFCDPRRFAELEALMVLANWTVFPTPLIWYKGNGMLPLPQHGPRRTYETILYAYRGDRPTKVVKSDCIVNVPAVRNPRHAAQKPVALYLDLLSRSANPGDTLLDFSGGVGTILPAANLAKCTATYIELDEKHYNVALSRASITEIDDGAPADDGIDIDLS